MHTLIFLKKVMSLPSLSNLTVTMPTNGKRPLQSEPLGDPTYTFTFSNVVENHKGMQQIGNPTMRSMTTTDLSRAAENIAKKIGPGSIQMIDLSTHLPQIPIDPPPKYDAPLKVKHAVEIDGACKHDEQTFPVEMFHPREASLLVVRNGVLACGTTPEAILEEAKNMKYDTKMYSAKHGAQGFVVNKNARWNNCIADESQEADILNKKGTVQTFSDLPELSKIRTGIGEFFGEPWTKLDAETNYYYMDPKTPTGIGFHGDTERNVVVGVRAGASMKLDFQWWYQNRPIGTRFSIELHSGDMYAMSFKTLGKDWGKSVWPTLRHAAGHEKYRKSNETILKEIEKRQAKRVK